MSDLIRIFGENRARKPSVYKGFENSNNEILQLISNYYIML